MKSGNGMREADLVRADCESLLVALKNSPRQLRDIGNHEAAEKIEALIQRIRFRLARVCYELPRGVWPPIDDGDDTAGEGEGHE